MLLTPTCPVCGEAAERVPCAACVPELRIAPPVVPRPPLCAVVALLAYEGAGRRLVTGFKYHNARSVVPWLADGMAELAAPFRADVVTWAPTSEQRRHERGFDQARLLARALARRLGLPCPGLLIRAAGEAQTGRDRCERLAGPTFVALGPPAPGPTIPTVLLVDDVVTTGATLAAAARALAPARAVAVVAAATP